MYLRGHETKFRCRTNNLHILEELSEGELRRGAPAAATAALVTLHVVQALVAPSELPPGLL